MKLEEAVEKLEAIVNECKDYNKERGADLYADVYEGDEPVPIEAIEIILKALEELGLENDKLKQELENSQEEYRQYKELCRQFREFIYVTGGKDVDDITATKYMTIRREGYLKGRTEEHERAIQSIKENYIPKKKIEDKINKLDLEIDEEYEKSMAYHQLVYARCVLKKILEDK